MDKHNENQLGSFGMEKKYLLKLYISGSAPRSVSAINQITAICKRHLNNYDLQIIDIYNNPELAKEAQIVAVPTLIKVLPLPERRLIGDMTDVEKVLAGLDFW
jgi:circadian clock protein KaiB